MGIDKLYSRKNIRKLGVKVHKQKATKPSELQLVFQKDVCIIIIVIDYMEVRV